MPNILKSFVKDATTILMENGVFYVAALFAALAVKYYYSLADAEHLGWILAPVARMVTMLSGMNFEWDLHSGFVNHSHSVVIAPACAGVNFLIICFATIFFTFVSRMKGIGAKCFWFGVSVITAYMVTVFTNTMRIIISIILYEAPIYGGWVTPGRLHQLAGIFTYILVLVGTCLIVERMFRRFIRSAPTGAPDKSRGIEGVQVTAAFLLAPFAWYLFVTVIIPFLNGSVRRYGAGFAEHSVMVMIACVCLFLAFASVMTLSKKNVDRLNKTKEKGENGRGGCKLL
jgi:exosortase K